MDGSPLAEALALLRQGHAAQAERMLRRLAAQGPADGVLRHVLGLALLALGRSDEALDEFDLVIGTPMESAALHFNRSLALSASQYPDVAEASLLRALELDPNFPGARTALVRLQLTRGDGAAALAHLELLLATELASAHLINLRGVALHLSGRFDEATACFEDAISRQPDFAEAWSNLGNLQYDQRKLESAQLSLERAVALAPGLALAHANLGMVRRDLDERTAARADFERALALRPGYPEALRRRAALNLLEGEFAAGWSDYVAANREIRQQSERSSGLRFWQGQPLQGKSVLLSEPSGLGDTLQLLRFAPRLQALGAKLAFTGPASLFRLLSSFGHDIEWLAQPDFNRFDFQCWLMELPHWLGLHDEQDFHAEPYLQAEPDRVARWSGHLERGMLNIGICWQGNPNRKMDAARSIPLHEFLPLAGVPGVRLVSLQKQFGLEQIAPARAAGLDLQELEDFDDGADAFLDSAALLQHLDLVVSADSSLTHLAGALGRPAWLALGQVPDWRWMLDRQDSPWYASVRLFRQSRDRAWRPVFEAMAEALPALVADRRGRS